MILVFLFGNIVERANAGVAGVVVAMFPSRDPAIVGHRARDVDDAGRPEIRPREFLFARPDEFDGLAGGFRESRGFDCALRPCAFRRNLNPYPER